MSSPQYSRAYPRISYQMRVALGQVGTMRVPQGNSPCFCGFVIDFVQRCPCTYMGQQKTRQLTIVVPGAVYVLRNLLDQLRAASQRAQHGFKLARFSRLPKPIGFQTKRSIIAYLPPRLHQEEGSTILGTSNSSCLGKI